MITISNYSRILLIIRKNCPENKKLYVYSQITLFVLLAIAFTVYLIAFRKQAHLNESLKNDKVTKRSMEIEVSKPVTARMYKTIVTNKVPNDLFYIKHILNPL